MLGNNGLGARKKHWEIHSHEPTATRREKRTETDSAGSFSTVHLETVIHQLHCRISKSPYACLSLSHTASQIHIYILGTELTPLSRLARGDWKPASVSFGDVLGDRWWTPSPLQKNQSCDFIVVFFSNSARLLSAEVKLFDSSSVQPTQRCPGSFHCSIHY